jgi:hypothetical protein
MFLFLSSAVAFAQITSENVDEVAAQEKSVQNSDITKSKDYISRLQKHLSDVGYSLPKSKKKNGLRTV